MHQILVPSQMDNESGLEGTLITHNLHNSLVHCHFVSVKIHFALTFKITGITMQAFYPFVYSSDMTLKLRHLTCLVITHATVVVSKLNVHSLQVNNHASGGFEVTQLAGAGLAIVMDGFVSGET